MRHFIGMIGIVLAIIFLGSLFFTFSEHLPLLDGLYLTLTTLSTVGYGDLVPHTPSGKWVAIALMVGGVGAALYIFSSVTSFVVEGRLRNLMGIRRMKKTIERMRGHYVVCGYGKLGKVIARNLEKADADFVIIEANTQKVADARDRGYSVIEGDATLPETLNQAGLERAAGLTTTMADDAENLYIGITARSILPDLPVVCRSSSERATSVFRRAGIEKTISTDEMGARRLVASLTRPYVMEFIDEITEQVEGRPSLHAVGLVEGAPLIGQSLIGARLRDDFGVIVLAINREGSYLPNPRGDEVLHANDILILVGKPEQITRLRALLQGVA